MDQQYVGTPLRRREDGPLLRGESRYTADVDRPGTVHAAILRSQYGHARLTDVDVTAAEAMDGVVGVYTGVDIAASDAPGVIRAPAAAPNGVETDFPVLATDRVRYVGDAVAVAVAEDPYVAHDALDAIDVDYERLDAVVDARAALADDAPAVHDYAPDNVAFDWAFGDEAAVDEAFAESPHTARIELRNQRLIGDPMEPRAVVAEYDGDSLTVTMSTQAPHQSRDHLAERLGLDPDRVRVVSPDVGGGFGIKGGSFPDEIIVGWCAMELGRPVKWVSTRSEAHEADYQSRDWYLDGELAFAEDGEIRGLRLRADHTVGAYYAFAPTLAGNVETLIAGQYEIPAIHGRTVGSFTNTAPIAPYRGAGRPETIYFLERLIDRAAAELGMDPVAFRRRNQIPSDAFPHETAVGVVYDSGDYERALDAALEAVGYDALRERQQRLREEGRYLGIGVSCFVENSASAPGMGETGRVHVADDGTVTAYLGTHDHGQGHGTTFAQLLADELEVPYEDVVIEEGDTADLPEGVGTFGSRSAALGGSAAVQAATEVRERARELAADHLEAPPTDLEYEGGAFHVRGAPDRSVHLRELASVDEVELAATSYYDPPNYGFSFGTHVAVVEVDPKTGEVDFERYVAVDDCGEIINPLIVEGQIHGGVAQGIGQALYEEAVYDENGQLLTGSLQDYTLPKSHQLPEIETEKTVTPSPHNPLGVKGTGESGTIAATPAVANAVVDALEPFGVDDLKLPITAETVWRAPREAE